jgi:hypothetical protein
MSGRLDPAEFIDQIEETVVRQDPGSMKPTKG